MTDGIDLDMALRQIVDAAEKGLKDGAEVILEESNDHIPLATGKTRNTGRVTADGLSAAISYKTLNAVVQHESMTNEHAPGRTAKFLENAMNSKRREAAEAITKRMRRELGS